MTASTSASLRCARCEYDLTGLDVSGKCPECGFSIDDTIRAAGQWTGARLRRLRLVAWLLVVAVVSWWIAFVSALSSYYAGPGLVAYYPALLAAVSTTHAASLGAAAIGGIYASSRRPSSTRIAMAAALGSLLIIAGGCLSLAFFDVRWLQRAFEDWGFAAAAAVRGVNIGVATAWLVVGIGHVAPTHRVRGSIAVGAACLIGLAWALLGALLLAEKLGGALSPWRSQIPAAVAMIVDSLALGVIGAVALWAACSRELGSALRAARDRSTSRNA